MLWINTKKRKFLNSLKSRHGSFVSIICICLFLVLAGVPCNVLAATANNHIDAIIVMDTSGSMNDSDKERVSIEAAKMFVDMMDINGSRVGMLGFSDTVASRIMMSDVDNTQDKEEIKKAIDNFTYQGYTDIGMALKQAQFIYDNAPKNGNSPIVLLFTDGNIEIDANNTARTYSESIQDINEVIKDAQNQFPIYTIGLNSDGSVDESLLQNIANATDGRCYVTNSPKDLPTIFNEIFADHIKSSIIDVDLFFSDGLTYKDVAINIPDNNVIEANIIIFSDKELIDAKITDPNGASVESNGASTAIFSTSSKYSIIKLIRPSKGDWTLSISGQKEDLIKVNLIFDYQLYINMSVSPQTNIKEGDKLNIEAALAADGTNILDPSFSETFDVHLIITGSGGNEIDRIKLEQSSSGVFKTTYTVSKETAEKNEQLTFYCKAESDRVYRESESISLTIIHEQPAPENEQEVTSQPQQTEQSPPVLKSEIKDISIIYIPILYGKAEITLSEYFENTLGYSISEPSHISSSIKDGKLILTPKSQNTGQVSIAADNGYGEKIQASFRVSTFNILPYILIVLAIIGAVLFTYLYKKSYKLKNTLFTGSIRMAAIDLQGSNSRPELIDLSFTTGMIELRDLVQGIDNGTLPLNKILIYPSFDDRGSPLLGVINKSNCSITGDFDIKISDKKFMWHNNMAIKIKNENNPEAYELELEYRY